MSFIIDRFQKGDKNTSECVILQATERLQANNYQVEDSTYKNGKKSNVYRHVLRLPKLVMEEGEYLAIFTQKGEPFTDKWKEEKCYNIFWGSDGNIWNNDETDSVEVLKVQTISRFPK